MISITNIDHVRLAMPPGEEQKACAFYANIPAMVEIPKPPDILKARWCWVSGRPRATLSHKSSLRQQN